MPIIVESMVMVRVRSSVRVTPPSVTNPEIGQELVLLELYVLVLGYLCHS